VFERNQLVGLINLGGKKRREDFSKTYGGDETVDICANFRIYSAALWIFGIHFFVCRTEGRVFN
jgi:hypothetical protein